MMKFFAFPNKYRTARFLSALSLLATSLLVVTIVGWLVGRKAPYSFVIRASPVVSDSEYIAGPTAKHLLIGSANGVIRVAYGEMGYRDESIRLITGSTTSVYLAELWLTLGHGFDSEYVSIMWGSGLDFTCQGYLLLPCVFLTSLMYALCRKAATGLARGFSPSPSEATGPQFDQQSDAGRKVSP